MRATYDLNIKKDIVSTIIVKYYHWVYKHLRVFNWFFNCETSLPIYIKDNISCICETSLSILHTACKKLHPLSPITDMSLLTVMRINTHC